MDADVTSLSLLQRLRDRGDQGAWREFHDLYAPLILNWLLARGIHPIDADDIRQEVLQVALAELPDFRHNGHTGALRAWLRQVVANRLRDFWRKQNRQPATPDPAVFNALAEQLADPQSELSQAWDLEYRRAICARLLEQVQGEFQEQTMAAFRRVAIEGAKPAAIAAELGMSANAVRIAQSRVLRRLRELSCGLLD